MIGSFGDVIFEDLIGTFCIVNLIKKLKIKFLYKYLIGTFCIVN